MTTVAGRASTLCPSIEGVKATDHAQNVSSTVTVVPATSWPTLVMMVRATTSASARVGSPAGRSIGSASHLAPLGQAVATPDALQVVAPSEDVEQSDPAGVA